MGAAPLENKKTIIGNTHGEPNFRKIKLNGVLGGDDWG
jgi:hypothetical protein